MPYPRLLAILCLCLLTTICAHATVINVPAGGIDQINAALAKAHPGDTVQLAAGTYAITETLKMPMAVKLLGAGTDKSIVHYTGDKPATMLVLTGVNDVEVARLTLDAENNPLVGRPVFGYNCKRLNLHHLAIRNTDPKDGNPAIQFSGDAKTYANGVLDSVVADCVLENLGLDSGWGCGIRFSWGSSGNSALRNTIRNAGRGGILTDNRSSDLTIRGNTVSGSGGEGLGIEVWGGCDRCMIEDNTLDHWLSIGGCDWCAVRRNTISDTSGTVKFIGIEGIGSYCLYTDNVVDDGQLIGISVSGSQPKDYCYYANNTVRKCLQWAAQFQGEAGGIGYNYFYQCKFNDTTVGRGKLPYPGYEGHGFRINGDMHHAVLDQCEMAGNGRYGVQLGGAKVDFLSFLKCAIVDNKGAAVADLRDYTAVEFTDCKVSGNGSNNLPPNKPFPTPAPQATLEGPAQAKVGQRVEFRCASPAADERGAVVLWDLGDGLPRRGDHVRYRYENPGKYLVAMILWDKNGRAVRLERLVEVK